MKQLLVIALVVFCLAAVWVMVRAGMTASRSVSLHASQSRTSQIGFGVLVFLATALLALYVFGWLLPEYHAGIVSVGLFVAVIGCFFAAALIPHVEGTWRELIHNAVAWGIVYLIPLIMAFMLQWQLDGGAWWAVVVMTLINSTLLLLSLIYYKQLRPAFLYFQLSYLAIFFGALLVVTYF